MSGFSGSGADARSVLRSVLPGIDEDALEYFDSLLADLGTTSGATNEASLKETLAPFIESYGLAQSLEEAEAMCSQMWLKLFPGSTTSTATVAAIEDDGPKLLDKKVNFVELSKEQISQKEQERMDQMWGFDKIRDKVNDTIYLNESGNAIFERRAMKDQRKWLADLEARFCGEEDDGGQISRMMMPDLSANSNEKDIHVHNFNITFGGQLLLENADLRLVCGRRYGLVGRNGIGKTTLLRHMAMFDIEGFPRHHRVLHVKQEVKSSEDSVLSVVLSSDVERNGLIEQEKSLLQKQQDMAETDPEFSKVNNELAMVYDRLSQIGADRAESRAAAILSGLQFTTEMQQAPISALSGGWRMRVALAGALFIEPDVLLLDEPTNHLDLNAVIWLQNYLHSYKNTILLVSHDRAFLNEVCTDIILFKDLKLTYYRGNYDLFESTRKEAMLVQQRQHEAQQVKLGHMQEFVDKFRYNAKRAALVQSRIKMIEKEDIIADVEDEKPFEFWFQDAGELGRPVIQLDDVTFGYSPDKILFEHVRLDVDLRSRVALVGPNGVGKSTVLNLVQGKLTALEGFIKINAQLRLGVFTQHHMDSFDLLISPLQNMMNRWPKATDAELRAHLGRYEVTGNDALKPMKFMSGGQKSRVAFAALTFSKPHVVILDEPTNHLDMEAIEALANALIDFKGGVVVISHDQYFIEKVCTEIWMVGDKTIKVYKGTFEEYKRSIIG